MKTFLMYALILVGFMFLSFVLEDGLLLGMYDKIDGNMDNGVFSGMEMKDLGGRASNVNGYLSFTLKNISDSNINCYGKIDLYSRQNLLAATKYIEIFDFSPKQEKEYQIKFSANDIAFYDVELVATIPDKTNIINILGWEIDLSNVFGMDLSDIKIFGVKITELFSWNNAKSAALNAWEMFTLVASSVPWWGYAIGGAIVLWYMPKKYLFGIFPF